MSQNSSCVLNGEIKKGIGPSALPGQEYDRFKAFHLKHPSYYIEFRTHVLNRMNGLDRMSIETCWQTFLDVMGDAKPVCFAKSHSGKTHFWKYYALLMAADPACGDVFKRLPSGLDVEESLLLSECKDAEISQSEINYRNWRIIADHLKSQNGFDFGNIVEVPGHGFIRVGCSTGELLKDLGSALACEIESAALRIMEIDNGNNATE